MRDKEFKRHMAYEALVLLGMLALLLYITRLWPILLLVILGIFIATLRLLFLSSKKVEPLQPILELPEPKTPSVPREGDVQQLGYWVIQNRITQILLSRSPDARWVWENPRVREDILLGNRVYILLNRAGGYRRGEVVIRNLQVVDILFEEIKDSNKPAKSDTQIENQSGRENENLPDQPEEEDEIPEDFGLMAFEWVNTHVMDLNDMGIDPYSRERIEEALIYTLTEAESRGHLCIPKQVYLQNCLKLLDTKGMTEAMLADSANHLLQNERIVIYADGVFRSRTARTESNLAYEIIKKMSGTVTPYTRLDEAIAAEEQKLHFRLAPEQKAAVKMGLSTKFCVITGGPGTGKTSVQKILLDLYKDQFPGAKIACCAPTGKAARRMEQSTGVPSSTVHRALGLLANEDGQYSEPQQLDADLVLVDEVSMLDVYLAENLLRSIPQHARLILIGDSDQLPSVGPGAVLKEIIDSGIVPVVKLDQVFRQKDGSRIAANAKLIRHGNLGLEYGPDFEFYDSTDINVSADIIESLYLQETAKYGVDNVVLLSPYRQKTETGVNALNQRLQGKVNPPADGKREATYGQRKFRVGDKVMQTKNCDDVNNGDVGYVVSIIGEPADAVVRVDFGDGRVMDYEHSDLDMLDLAYACTVHKSQGAEFKSVIINLQCAHAVMLVRPLIYTAITRAKERVILVGERRALCTAIRRTDTEHRGTKLAIRIREFYNMNNRR